MPDDEVKEEEQQEVSGESTLSESVLDAFDDEAAPIPETVSLDALADEEEEEIEKVESEDEEYPIDSGDLEEESQW